jgi:RNA polymerase sigma-70 factor, ECF subfamily
VAANESMCLKPEGLTELMRGSYAEIRRSARRILKDDDEAQDIAQEVFLRALRKEEAEGITAPPAWLYRVAINLCLNRLRDARRRRELMLQYLPEVWLPAPPDASATLHQLVGEIPDDLECAVLRHYVGDETHHEIARVMGVSRRTVGNRIAAFHAWLAARSDERR